MLLRFVRCFYHRWVQYEVTLRAAALTYYSMFSIFPALLLLTSGLGLLLHDPTYQRRVTEFLADFLPQRSRIIPRLIQEVVAPHSVTSLIAALTLLWAASGFLQGLLSAVVLIHDGKRSRNVIFLRAWSMALLAALMILVLLVLALVSLLSRVLALFPPVAGDAAASWAAEHIVVYGAGTIAFYLLFRFFPRNKGRVWTTLLSAFLTALAWGALNSAFAQYLTVNLPHLNFIYGPIAAVMALMLYLFFINLVVLGGALVHAVLDDLADCAPPPLPFEQWLKKI